MKKWQHNAQTCRTKQVKNTGVLSSSPTWPSLVQSHIVSLSTLAFLPATLVSVAPSLPPKPSFLVQWDARGRKQGQQSKGCAEIKSLTIQSLTVHCSATWVEATRADVLIWRWPGQTERSCEPAWWREDMERSGGGKPFWEQEVNRSSAQLALSSITGHFFGCRRGTAKSTAIGDPWSLSAWDSSCTSGTRAQAWGSGESVSGSSRAQ